MSRSSIFVVIMSAIITTLIASSAEASTVATSNSANSPLVYLGLVLGAAAALYVAMTWGDKREPYKTM